MASIQRRDELRKYAPHEFFVRILVPHLQLFDHLAEITIAAEFHVQMKVLGRFVVFSLVVSDNVGVSEFLEDGEFCLQLLALFGRHFGVTDLLSTEHLKYDVRYNEVNSVQVLSLPVHLTCV